MTWKSSDSARDLNLCDSGEGRNVALSSSPSLTTVKCGDVSHEEKSIHWHYTF